MLINNYGIWIGEDSVVAVTENLSIAFLRLQKDLIISVIKYQNVTEVVYGNATNQTSEVFKETPHTSDKISYDGAKLIYTTYDNKVFENILAEKIEMNDFTRYNEIDNNLSVAEKMERWNIKAYLQTGDNQIRAGIDTRKYSIFYCVDLNNTRFIYCRVGQNGYCAKGWAMLPTIEIRHHLVRMTEVNLSSVNDYKPNEDWFVENSCTFSADGGWYWALKDVSDDVIHFQGCGGDIYGIPRI